MTLVLMLGIVPAGHAESLSIDPLILDELAADGRAEVFVKLAANANLEGAERISGRVERLQFVYDTLAAHAASSQQNIKSFLDGRGIRFQSFWINNSLYVYEADLALVQTLAGRNDVAYLRGNRLVPLDVPVAREIGPKQIRAVEWGVRRINSPDVWAAGNTGEGAVVANIDTGVRYTHEALVDQYRGNNGDGTFDHDYNWWDPLMDGPGPYDNVGHGTHTMGTAVGGDASGPLTDDIGVAPGARWITAKGCENVSCSSFSLISSAQWIACPTRVDGSMPDCSKAPHVVNNSWGGAGGDSWYQSYVDSWVAAGIVPVFGIGSSGPSCNTAGSPADYKNVIGVSATDMSDGLASFSSRGPGTFRKLKPDLVAPGVSVRSAYNGSDTEYLILTGTSMAVPHVVGTVALYLSAHPGASSAAVYRALTNTAGRNLGDPPNPDSCGGRAYDVYPNPIYGWGRVDAAAAVAAP